MKKNFFLAAALSLLMSAGFVACDDDDPVVDLPTDEPTEEPDEPEEPADEPETVTYYYVLNSGQNGSNNASLSLYNTATKEVVSDIFMDKNGRGLGDTANDMLRYGDKIYIAVYGSEAIEVTDMDGNSLKQIQSVTGDPLLPRYLTSYEGKVYASLYDGFVARLDTASLEIEATVAVGRNPEQLVVSNGKLYVANSGGMDYNTPLGYDKTVSVIDLASFTETEKLEVVINPCNMVADAQGDVYLVSMGNYGDVPNTLQRIDTQNDEVETVSATNATEMALFGDDIFMMYSQYDANWNQTISYIRYNALSEQVVTDAWITEPIAKPYKIGADLATETLFVTESDYTNNGDVYSFSSDGTLKEKFEVGLNPIKVIPFSGTENQ